MVATSGLHAGGVRRAPPPLRLGDAGLLVNLRCGTCDGASTVVVGFFLAEMILVGFHSILLVDY